MEDIHGRAAVEIKNLYKDKTLTAKQQRKETLKILKTFANKLEERQAGYIARLKNDSDNLKTIKSLLS